MVSEDFVGPPKNEHSLGCGQPGEQINLPLQFLMVNNSKDHINNLRDGVIKHKFGVFDSLDSQQLVTSWQHTQCEGKSVR